MVQHRVAILETRRKRMLGGEAIIDADDDGARMIADAPGDNVAAFEAPFDEGAAVEINDAGARIDRARWPIDSYGNSRACTFRRRYHRISDNHTSRVRPPHTGTIGIPSCPGARRISVLRRCVLCRDELGHLRVDIEVALHLPSSGIVIVILSAASCRLTTSPWLVLNNPEICPSHPASGAWQK